MMNAELARKLEQVRSLIKQQKAGAVLINKQSNFSWLSCGGEAHIPLNTDRTLASLVVTPQKFYLLANKIEMPRLQAEVTRKLGTEPALYPWFDPQEPQKILKTMAPLTKLISDTGDFGTLAHPELFPPLRFSLQTAEIKRYKSLGKAAEEAMRVACQTIKPGMSEFQIASTLAAETWNREMTPVVLLVAADERIRKFRHPLPSAKKLKKHVMLVLCARRHGLIVALTRVVHFGKIPASLRKIHQAVCAVDVTFNWNTVPGANIATVFRAGIKAYAEAGVPDEWTLHHQGGACGYEGRDYIASLSTKGAVQTNQPFAWNPSITGSKSEDTILATSKGPEIITAAVDWPMVDVPFGNGAVQRPDILERA